jgi:CheY-like chemotaxis protein/HPt (histidine-containing phosphotransfer) domain-containing protein
MQSPALTKCVEHPAVVGTVSKGRHHILVADDNEINQLVAVEMLRTAGYQTTVVSNGLEAVEALENGKFHVVLMDCQMPEMDGFTATRRIRLRETEGLECCMLGGPIPIIALTAQAVQGDREQCLEAGMTDYVTKPIDREVLMKTLRQFLRREPRPVDGDTTNGPEGSHARTQASGPETPVLDLRQLTERCLGDDAFVEQILRLFVTKARDSVARIEASIESGEAERIASSAHELKGSAGNVAAMRLGTAVAELESAARTNADGDYGAFRDRIVQEFIHCEQAIECLLNDAGTRR